MQMPMEAVIFVERHTNIRVTQQGDRQLPHQLPSKARARLSIETVHTVWLSGVASKMEKSREGGHIEDTMHIICQCRLEKD